MRENQEPVKRNVYVADAGLKVDFHIHSCHSSHRDKDLTSGNTLENLPVLVNALNKHGVNMAAITDHDVFSYEMYKRFKENEGNGYLKKVLPGVEFSVAMHAEKDAEKAKREVDGSYVAPVHVIALFNDADPDKLANIEMVLGNGFDEHGIKNPPAYDSVFKGYYKEATFIDLLSKIGLDVVLIAHQKTSLNSPSGPTNNDLNSTGKEEFNRYLFAEYFQALEFRNRKNELQNTKAEQRYTSDLLRFITGSDCHDWKVYPSHDENQSHRDDFKFTYFKCLPTFRGVSLALTGSNRISLVNSFFGAGEKNLSRIDFTIEGNPFSIPLSKGVNVIIGDNSIGKSLLLHKITNYYRADFDTSSLTTKLKNKYEEYLKEHKMDVKTSLPSEWIYQFDTQGEISKKFTLKRLDSGAFVGKLSMPNPAIERAKTEVENFASIYLANLKHIARKNESMQRLKVSNVKILSNALEGVVLKTESASDAKSRTAKSVEDKIVTAAKKAIGTLKELVEVLPNGEEKTKVLEFKDYLSLMESEHERCSSDLQNEIQFIAEINTILKAFNQEQQKTDDDKEIELHNLQIKALAEAIKEAKDVSGINGFANPHINELITIKPTSITYGQYKIVNRSLVGLVDDTYLLELFSSPFKKDRFSEASFLNKANLSDALFRFDGSDPWLFYEQKIAEKIGNDIREETKIVAVDDPDEKDYSSGFNDRMYFEVLASDTEHDGIYLIDQPEDDVSQRAIKDYLIPSIRAMSKIRQVIMVTHNPQFVVNLDVDNVIYLHQDDGQIKIDHGALEYQDEETDILKDVADALDGGAITIQRRWKKYEKNLDDILN